MQLLDLYAASKLWLSIGETCCKGMELRTMKGIVQHPCMWVPWLMLHYEAAQCRGSSLHSLVSVLLYHS